jgi:hypothetical protein
MGSTCLQTALAGPARLHFPHSPPAPPLSSITSPLCTPVHHVTKPMHLSCTTGSLASVLAKYAFDDEQTNFVSHGACALYELASDQVPPAAYMLTMITLIRCLAYLDLFPPPPSTHTRTHTHTHTHTQIPAYHRWNGWCVSRGSSGWCAWYFAAFVVQWWCMWSGGRLLFVAVMHAGWMRASPMHKRTPCAGAGGLHASRQLDHADEPGTHMKPLHHTPHAPSFIDHPLHNHYIAT